MQTKSSHKQAQKFRTKSWLVPIGSCGLRIVHFGTEHKTSQYKQQQSTDDIRMATSQAVAKHISNTVIELLSVDQKLCQFARIVVQSAWCNLHSRNCTVQFLQPNLHNPMCTIHFDLSDIIKSVIVRSKEEGKWYLKHSCEAHLLVVSGCAKMHGARNICGAAVKLSTTVQQQQCVLVHLLAAALLSSVMDDSSIPTCSCNMASNHLVKGCSVYEVGACQSRMYGHEWSRHEESMCSSIGQRMQTMLNLALLDIGFLTGSCGRNCLKVMRKGEHLMPFCSIHYCKDSGASAHDAQHFPCF